jgi:ABC-type Mn2+/Zn2+ transport system permease subunit
MRGEVATVSALLIGVIGRRGVVRYDTAIGILFVAMFALASDSGSTTIRRTSSRSSW